MELNELCAQARRVLAGDSAPDGESKCLARLIVDYHRSQCTHTSGFTKPSGGVYCQDCGAMIPLPVTGYLGR
jgi:hypothetical protein